MEKRLLRIALIVSILGIVLLYIIMQTREIKTVTSIEDNIGEIIKIKGKVIRVENLDKVSYLTITIEKPIDVILFKDSKFEVPIGSNVMIKGEIKDKDQLIGHQIEFIQN